MTRNIDQYEPWQEVLRRRQFPMLIVWGAPTRPSSVKSRSTAKAALTSLS